MKHKLTATNTLWVFVCCPTEARHLDDIVFAVDALRKRGVPDGNMIFFLDHPLPGPHLQPYGISDIASLADMQSRLEKSSGYEHAFLIVGGHGNATGLHSNGQLAITPAALFDIIRKVPGIQAAVVALTQCYAGVFNYQDAASQPPLVVLGATNLHPSLSVTLQLSNPLTQASGAPGLSSWGANIFMCELFIWLRQPMDIDGDGVLSLMDAYKFAGVRSNRQLTEAKRTLFFQVPRFAEQLDKAKKAVPPDKVTIDAAATLLSQGVDNLHLHQEPWILHANLARAIEF